MAAHFLLAFKSRDDALFVAQPDPARHSEAS